MKKKKLMVGGTIAVLVLFLISVPQFSACEQQEEPIDEEESFKESFDGSGSFTSYGLFDYLLDRYPILDQIMEMLLDLLYNWLSSYTIS